MIFFFCEINLSFWHKRLLLKLVNSNSSIIVFVVVFDANCFTWLSHQSYWNSGIYCLSLQVLEYVFFLVTGQNLFRSPAPWEHSTQDKMLFPLKIRSNPDGRPQGLLRRESISLQIPQTWPYSGRSCKLSLKK